MSKSSAATSPAITSKLDGRKENAAVTQAALRTAGRRLFGRQGYEATSVSALCADAGVTAGALYHHFGDKKGLFAAVAEELDSNLVKLVTKVSGDTVAKGGTPWDAFLAGVDALLRAGVEREARRIGLFDAPAVLGSEAWVAIRERHGLGAMIRNPAKAALDFCSAQNEGAQTSAAPSVPAVRAVSAASSDAIG